MAQLRATDAGGARSLRRDVHWNMVDVGANTGFYSLLAARIRPDVQIVAVEPYPPIVRLLERNIALNGFTARIEVVRKALGDSTGIAELFVPSAAHGLDRDECDAECRVQGVLRVINAGTRSKHWTASSAIGTWVSSRSMSRALRTSCSMERDGASPSIALSCSSKSSDSRTWNELISCDERSGTSTFRSRQGASCSRRPWRSIRWDSTTSGRLENAWTMSGRSWSAPDSRLSSASPSAAPSRGCGRSAAHPGVVLPTGGPAGPAMAAPRRAGPACRQVDLPRMAPAVGVGTARRRSHRSIRCADRRLPRHEKASVSRSR